MKTILSILFLLPTLLLSQNLPQIKSNFSTEELDNSLIWKEFSNKYEQVLSFTRESYWHSNKIYIIFGKSHERWERIKWILELDENKEIKQKYIQVLSFKKHKFKKLLTYFDSLNFWTFNLDSLNLREDVKGDGSSTLWIKSDGTNDSFEVINNGQYRLISSYEPEYFQELIPIEQRRKFIECRDLFMRQNGVK